MEATGLAVGIVALYFLCQDGYRFNVGFQDAPDDLVALQRHLAVQHSVMSSQGAYWEIESDFLPGGERGALELAGTRKINAYLKDKRHKAYGVAVSLYSLGTLFTAVDKLHRYGVKLKAYGGLDTRGSARQTQNYLGPRNQIPPWADLKTEVESAGQQVRESLTKLRRFRWVAADASKTKTLIEEIRFCNDDLWRLCPDGAAEALTSSMIVSYFSNNPDQISQDVPTTSPEEDESSPSLRGQAVLRQIADLRDQVRRLSSRQLTESEKKALVSIDERDFNVGKGSVANMIVLLSSSQAMFLEKLSYTRNNKESKAVRDDILKLGRFLREQPVTEGILSLRLHALVQLRGEIGFIYELPPAIAAHSVSAPSDDMNVRAPASLADLLSTSRCPALGQRFELARKLTRAITFLHASGWLHKNIRPESIIFFNNPHQRGGTPSADIDNPYLTGYIYSRPEEVEDPPASTRSQALAEIIAKGSRAVAGYRVLMSRLASPSNEQTTRPRSRGRESERQIEEHYTRSTSGSSTSSGSVEQRNQHRWRINLDHYQHPTKHHFPLQRYRPAFDIYSFGLVLLAIGLWSDLEDEFDAAWDLQGSEPPEPSEADWFGFRGRLIRQTQDDLMARCG